MDDLRILANDDRILSLVNFTSVATAEDGTERYQLLLFKDITGPRSIPIADIDSMKQQAIDQELKSHFGVWDNQFIHTAGYTVKSPALPVGSSYYPRIYRPTVATNLPVRDWNEHFFYRDYNVTTRSQIGRMLRAFRIASEVIWPSRKNYLAYGIALREFIILACTELEAVWRGIMEANNYTPTNGRTFTTRDYVKLNQCLQLGAYSVEFLEFPDLPPFSPFQVWDPLMPTASLQFYDAYNKIKHDREAELENANLETALNTLAALLIAAAGQMGSDMLESSLVDKLPFRFSCKPGWRAVEHYVPNLRRDLWGSSTDFSF